MDKEVELILLKLKIVSEEEERGMYLCDKEHSKILLDCITDLQENYDRAMKLVDKGVENSYKKIKEQQKEIEKLTAESTEWEERTYCWQDRAEDLQITIDKAIEYIKGWQSFPHTNGSTHNELRNLLNILQGEGKDE